MRSRRVFWVLLAVVMGSLAVQPAASPAANITAYVGCSINATAIASHVCQIGDAPGAFFESDVDTEYEICLTFPDAETLCVEEEPAEAGVLYVNEITTDLTGNYLTSWYIEGVEVASWSFRMDAPPAPPVQTPPTSTPTPAPAAAPVVTPSPVVPPACLQAQQQVEKLKARLHKAVGSKKKAKVRASLKSARATAKKACA
jgi:hypothetical protein